MNLLRKGLTDYLELRRGLGFKLVIDERHLRAFIAFLECRKTSHITTRLALEFATLRKNLDPRSWVQRLCALRAFALYWQGFDPKTEVPPVARWYQAGEQVEHRLPALSTYLGHVNVASTYWYLSCTPELAAAASERIEARWKGVTQ